MSVFHSTRTPALCLVATLAVAALTAGCSSSKTGSSPITAAPMGHLSQSSAPSDNSSTDGADSGSAAPSPGSDGSVVGGTALQTKLAAVTVPSGYTVDSASKDSSGSTPTTPSDYEGLQGCSDLTNASADTLTSDHEAAYATYDLQNSDGASISVVVADYYPGDADKQLSEVATVIGKCPNYQATDSDGKKVTINVTSTAKSLGDQAVDIHLGAAQSGYVSDEFLLVRKGNLIIALSQDDAAGNSLADLATLAAPYLSALS